MRSDVAILVVAFAGGTTIGLVFYGGLYWTVSKGLSGSYNHRRNPRNWFLCSQIMRLFVALTGFYLIASGSWQRLLICLLGVLLGRGGVTIITRPGTVDNALNKEVRHAP